MSETNRLQRDGPPSPQVRYIKLGPSGSWLRRCLSNGVIELGHGAIPHEIALAGNWDEAEQLYRAGGTTPGKAKDFVREIRDFYTLGPEDIWITIGDGRVWWGRAEVEVMAVVEDGRGRRVRRIQWSDRSSKGDLLDLASLSTRLTKVAAYRQTICRVEAQDYLLRRIDGLEQPSLVRAREARAAAIRSAQELIEALDWRDFEVMVDLIFADSGWRRVSAVGGSDQADSDLILEQPATRERAMVQVKSRASRTVLADYVDRFDRSPMDRLFFVCHSPTGDLKPPARTNVHIWLGEKLAEQAIAAGLFDWLMAKCR